MGIPNMTSIKIQAEGIAGVEYLVVFDKETINQIAANLRLPVRKVADTKPGASTGAKIPTTPFVFGSKSQHRFIHSTKLIRYYDTVRCVFTAANLQWTPVMKNFYEQWKE